MTSKQAELTGWQAACKRPISVGGPSLPSATKARQRPLSAHLQLDPIVAHKVARIVKTGSGFSLAGAAYAVPPYRMTDVARHLGPNWRSSPHALETCTCGFYAVPSLRQALEVRRWLSTAEAVLKVELYGKIVRHERGYRAEKQRVLEVTLWPLCRCNRAATSLWVSTVSPLLIPMCRACLDQLPLPDRLERVKRRHLVSLADLANAWSMDVRWLTEEEIH